MSEVPIGGAHHTAQSILLEELTQGRPICVRCGSSSMRPQIVPGDMLTIAPVSLDQIQRGDIVLMAAGEEWIVHRLLAIRKKNGRKYAVTRGDDINRLDTPVILECILGKVTGIHRNGREKILKSTCLQRLKARCALATIQARDHARPCAALGKRVVNLLRRIKHSRWLFHPDEKPDIAALFLQCSLPAQDNLSALFQAIKTTVGWERFLKIADVEGLSELIYYNFKEQITSGLIPPEACRSLENAYLTTLARNTLFLAKLEQIAHALAGLDFIVLKGAYLARHVYASPGLRRFSDIDILIKRADLTEADLRLAKIGYLPTPTDLSAIALAKVEAGSWLRRSATPRQVAKVGQCADSIAGPREDGKISSFLNSVMYYPAGNEIAIDVHWHLLNSYLSHYLNATLDIGAIWQAARPPAVAKPAMAGVGRSTSAGLELCPEHLIVHLAEHALHHSFERLILLRDIAEVIIRFGDALDWNRLVGECRKFNLARPVFYSLLFISAKTSVPVPAMALDALCPARLGRAEKLFIRLILRGQRYPELCNLAYLDNTISFGAKIRFVLRLVFPCREVMALTYSRRVHEIGPGVYILRLAHGMGYLTRAMVYHALRVVHFLCRWTKRASGIQSAGLI